MRWNESGLGFVFGLQLGGVGVSFRGFAPLSWTNKLNLNIPLLETNTPRLWSRTSTCVRRQTSICVWRRPSTCWRRTPDSVWSRAFSQTKLKSGQPQKWVKIGTFLENWQNLGKIRTNFYKFPAQKRLSRFFQKVPLYLGRKSKIGT